MAKLIDLGIDYLTITEKDSERWNVLVQWLERNIYPEMLANGHTFDSTKALGYNGTRLGTIFAGVRSDSSMLRVSGADAHRVLNSLLLSGLPLHVTRIDLQATVAFEADRMLYAEECKAQALCHQETTPARSHPGITLISTNGRGDTLQIGSRASEVFCRIYDKWREQALDYQPYTWRYEVEFKGSTAEKALRLLREATDLSGQVQAMLCGVFTDRGIIEPALQGMRPHTLKASRTETDDDKSLRWLRSHVKGTVEKLVAHGHKEQVLDILSCLC